MHYPEGIISVVVTPMTADEKINEAELRRQVNRMIEAGIHGIFCGGTSGELYGLDDDEVLEVTRIVISETRGRIPVYGGTGRVTTRDTVRLSLKVRDLGVQAVSVVTPYYVKVGQDDLVRHYEDITEAVGIPVIIYNIPPRTGVNMEPGTLAKLADIPNLVGIKDSSGNFDNILKYIEEAGDRVSVVSGNDSLILWTLLAGGKGGISGIANIFPERMVRIYEHWKAGNLAEARKVQDSVRPIRNALAFGNPNSVVKRAMNMLGYAVGPARRPVSGIDAASEAKLRDILRGYEEAQGCPLE
jgi:4-hydroxy-tetrahydrodipicolinate synthase